MSPRTWFRLVVLSAMLVVLGFTVPSWAQAGKGKKYALIVGINAYEHAKLPPLKYAENDAAELARVLQAPSAGFARVRVLTTVRGKKDRDDLPTARNVKTALAELFKGKTRRDTVLIALSGHGLQLEVRDPQGKGAARTFPFFCPTDAQLNDTDYGTGSSPTLVNLDHVLHDLGECGAGAKLLLVDACRNDVKARNVNVSKVTIPDGVAALFSCKAGERAWETDRLGKGHGVFFYYVLEALRGRARNEDNEVTWDDLRNYVRRQVPRRVPVLIGGGARQTPQAIENSLGSSPVLVQMEVVSEAEKQYRRGMDLYEGRGVSIDREGAVRCFRQAARQDHDLACAMLGFCYFQGIGINKNETEARRWARRGLAGVQDGAARGLVEAETILGRLFDYGLGVEKDHKEAVKWYSKAVAKGHPRAMACLGFMYAFGQGVEKDDKEAVKWFRKAAAKGAASGMFSLGVMYEDGRGVERDYKEAFRWYSKAADKGDAAAMYNLGLLYENGEGVARSRTEAVRWYRRAAKLGDRDAQHKLRSLGE
jgi:TPR repeat protein